MACRNGVELGRIAEQRKMVVRELTVNCTPASSEVKCEQGSGRNKSSSKSGSIKACLKFYESTLRALFLAKWQ